MNKKEIIIFTDGASRGNPGPGGFGAVIVRDDKVFELGGAEKNTTNNRMELTAAIKSLAETLVLVVDLHQEDRHDLDFFGG